MPNINQIEQNGVVYDLEDAQARDTLQNVLVNYTAYTGTDVNLINENSYYYVSGTISNIPVANFAYIIETIKVTNTNFMQHAYGFSGTEKGKIYTRTGNPAGTWFNWVDVNTKEETDISLKETGVSADAAAVGGIVGQISEHLSGNLFNPLALIKYRLIDGSGNEVQSDIYNTTDYIPVTANRYIFRSFSHTGTPTYRIAQYNAQKTFLSRKTALSTNYPDGYSFVLDAGTAYIRVTIENSANSYAVVDPFKYVIVEGNAVSEYTPYWEAFDRTAREAVTNLQDVVDANADSETLSIKGQTNYDSLKHGHYINSSHAWANDNNYVYAMIPVNAGDIIKIKAGQAVCIYAFLKSDYAGTSTVDFADGVSGRSIVNAGASTVVQVPATTNYVYILVNNGIANYSQWFYWPEILLINGENVSWPVRYLADQNHKLALTSYNSIYNGNGLPYLRDSYSVGSDGTWKAGDYKYALFPVSVNDQITIIAGTLDCFYAFIDHDVIPGENRVAFAGNETARRTVTAGGIANVTAPVGSVYLYILYYIGAYAYYPQKLIINGVDVIGALRQSGTGAFKYETGTFLNGVATEKLTIAFPSGVNFVGYVMYRYVFPDNNCNLWRLFSFNVFDNLLNSVATLSAKGEMECAVSLQGRPDFSGGSTHGDEIMTDYAVFVDGKNITTNLSNYAYKMPFKELRLVRESKLYDPNDHETEIADHGVEYVFSEGVLTVNQSLKWLVADSLSSCYMAMFTPNKSYTDHYYTDVGYSVGTFPGDNYGFNIENAKHAIAYGANGFWGEFWVEKYPEGLTGGDRMLFTDNSGNAYNKMYYVICNAGQTSIGELWRTVTKYRIRFS